MTFYNISQELMSLHISQNQSAVQRFLASHPLADCAEAFVALIDDQQLNVLEVRDLFRLMTPESQITLLEYLPLTLQTNLAEYLDITELVQLTQNMAHDERADLIATLSIPLQQQVLSTIEHEHRVDIEQLTSYPQSSVGAIMTSDFATLAMNSTVEDAIKQLKHIARDSETIYQAYVVDVQECLQGTVSLRDLILAKPLQTISEIMTRVCIFVRVEEAQHIASQAIRKYDLLALPVLDINNRLIGIVTYDDAMDVAEEHVDRHIHKTAAVNYSGNLKDASITLMYRKRVFWLVLLVFGNIFSGAGIAHFEDMIESYIALVFFLPLLIDSGGNAGSQSATLMVRALATGDIIAKDWAKMLGKELMIAALLGITMALAVSFLGFWRGGYDIALVVAVTMQIVVLVGSVVGMSLPFLLNKMKLDPASASAPLVTSIADALGVLIYFSVASLILDMPVSI
ncbi:magnesium transporter [Vibrio sp. ZSDZ65]|uniref:Magnesium transporter MgtE n=1 Tax=Vibrio qingdaonensis TaxID=2829491 RepID=A0A9X3CSW8_9VIBR|nr:magnesium transporter [Vibrio qingdaonensis]MCW8349157.1 magnesium transporter [Vibrio qingdaonensis]